MSNFFSSSGDNKQDLFKLDSSASSGEDFFADIPDKKDEKTKDNSLDGQYRELENNYQQIFIEAAESIRKELDTFKPENPCETCANKKDCKIEKFDIFAQYPANGCKYRDWQLKAITYLTGDYRQKHKSVYTQMMEKKNEYECNKCGACCKLAVSEFSYEQLKQRAMRGDKFSEQFISVFVPYESEEEAKKVDPEYFALLNRLVQEDKIYYYYCPKLGENNLCTIYEERPDICRDFPHNPLKLLPSKCSFNEWKSSVSHTAMLLKAKTDIIEYYKERLQ